MASTLVNFVTQYWPRQVAFAQSARRHKIGRIRVRHVLCDPVAVFTVPSPDGQTPERLLYLGDDHTGRPLEVVTVAVGDGELVIHAMDLRAKYRPSYEQAKEVAADEGP
jgi:hypothetical protein